MAESLPDRSKYDGYPLSGIKEPHPHDVLCGRGGGTNNHIGNLHWRMLVAANKELYVSLPKRQKLLLSKSVVNAVRSQSPPGRFLSKDKTEFYSDIGDQKAAEKTSQALREGAPDLRNKIKDTDSITAPPDVVSSTHSRSSEAGGPIPTSVVLNSSKQSLHSASLDDINNNSISGPGIAFPEPVRYDMKPPPPQKYPQGGRNPMSASVRDSKPCAMPPPTSFDPSPGFSFGSVTMSDEAQRRLEREHTLPIHNQQQQHQQRIVNFDNSVVMRKNAGQMNNIRQMQHHQHLLQQQQQQMHQHVSGSADYAAPVDGGLERAGLSTGTAMSMGTINSGLFNEVPEMVDGGLEPAGFSFGTMMSTTEATAEALAGGPKLESNVGTSFGSMMSYKPEAVDGGLEAIGTSFGSLSLANDKKIAADVDAAITSVKEEAVPQNIAPPLLQQRKSKASLLACSDSEDDESDGGVDIINNDTSTTPTAPSISGGDWNRMQAAFAAQRSQASGSNLSVSGGSASLMPPPPQQVYYRASNSSLPSNNGNNININNAQDPTILDVPTTQNLHWNVSGMTEVDPFEPTPMPPGPLQKVMKDVDRQWDSFEASLLQGPCQQFNLPPSSARPPPNNNVNNSHQHNLNGNAHNSNHHNTNNHGSGNINNSNHDRQQRNVF